MVQRAAFSIVRKIGLGFTSSSWIFTNPDTFQVLFMETFEHCPLLVSFSSATPKGQVFRFENFWLHQQGFIDLLQHEWSLPQPINDCAKIVTPKLKKLRKILKARNANLSNLKTNIANSKLVIEFLGVVEYYIDLSLEEWNFREILRADLLC